MHKFYKKMFPKDHKTVSVNKQDKEKYDHEERLHFHAYPSNHKYNGPT